MVFQKTIKNNTEQHLLFMEFAHQMKSPFNAIIAYQNQNNSTNSYQKSLVEKSKYNSKLIHNFIEDLKRTDIFSTFEL